MNHRSLLVLVPSIALFTVSGCATEAGEDAESSQEALSSISRVVCESNGYRYEECDVDTRRGRIIDARVRRQLSSSPCTEGESWGYARDSIWVDRGCRAEFAVTIRPNDPSQEGIVCRSAGYRYRRCETSFDIITNVQLVQQESSARCRSGYSYGIDGDGIWVDHGCRGEFTVVGYGGGSHGRPMITVFDNPNFEGEARTFRREMNDLVETDFNNRISSVIVHRGTWEVCNRPDFASHCTTFEAGRHTSVPLNDLYSSLRPR